MNDRISMTRDIDSLVSSLPEAVRLTLADLHGAPRQAVETTIALLPFGRRALLEAVQITHTATVEGTEGGAGRQQLRVTDWGWQVIAACAAYGAPVTDINAERRRTGKLRAQLSTVTPCGRADRTAGAEDRAPVTAMPPA